jgi:Xaa-Pro aminopeptidase
MHAVLTRGRYAWDQKLLPLDEYVDRLGRLERACMPQGARAVVVVGSARETAGLTYLTNYMPPSAPAVLVAVPGAEPTLFAGLGGGRDHPFIRSICWVTDLRYHPRLGQGVAQILAERRVEGGVLCTAGARRAMAAGAYRAFVEDLAAYELVPIDEELERLRRCKRPRELRVMRQAAGVLAEAKLAAVRAARSGKSPFGAVAEADRVARLGGCHDFRALICHSDGSLRPYQGAPGSPAEADGRGGPPGTLVAYLAAEYLGYWADAAVTYPWTAVDRSIDPRATLEAVCEAIRPGAERDLANLASEHAGEVRVNGIGLELDESPLAAPGLEWEIARGDVLSVHVRGANGSRTAWVSREVVVTDNGSSPLSASAGD